MKFLDAMLVLALAAHIHGTDKAVSRAASLVVKRVSPQNRPIIAAVIKSPRACAMVLHILATTPDWMLTPGAKPEPVGRANAA